MRALQLDYQRRQRAVPWLGFGMLVASLGLFALLAFEWQAADKQTQALEAVADRLARQSSRHALAPRAASDPASRVQLLEVKQANQVVRELTVPWNALFEAVEAAGGEGVALLALEPDSQKGSVRITGEAKNLDLLLAYVKQLGSQPPFAGALLQSHQVQREVAERPLRFVVLVRWKGVAS